MVPRGGAALALTINALAQSGTDSASTTTQAFHCGVPLVHCFEPMWHDGNLRTFLPVAFVVAMLMIGYSFGDQHVNEALVRAAQCRHLEPFVINPPGAVAPGQQNYEKSAIEEELEHALSVLLVVQCRKFLQCDHADHAKVRRFFSQMRE